MKIKMGSIRHHRKASEAYIPVEFSYADKSVVHWDIPIEYRRTGTHLLEKNEAERVEFIQKTYSECAPSNWSKWHEEQRKFWLTKPNAETTKPFFDKLCSSFDWMSVESDLPKNPNWARRIQDIKEFGYTLATDTARVDKKTGVKTTHILLLPITRGGITGYEVWTKELREKIISVLAGYDCYEAKKTNKEGLLPDHKFPEIRWNKNTKRENLSELTNQEIKRDFQLLNNQRNQQKREVCRTCYQTNQRGELYGIGFYYKGTKEWDSTIPKRGIEAKKGCEGCGWYDIEQWRMSLKQKL